MPSFLVLQAIHPPSLSFFPPVWRAFGAQAETERKVVLVPLPSAALRLAWLQKRPPAAGFNLARSARFTNRSFATGVPSLSLPLPHFCGIFLLMSATLTVPVDPGTLALAEQEAKAHHTTLPDVVALHLRVMAKNWQDSRGGRTPLTDELRGAVQLPPNFDLRADLTEELQKKHGVQG